MEMLSRERRVLFRGSKSAHVFSHCGKGPLLLWRILLIESAHAPCTITTKQESPCKYKSRRAESRNRTGNVQTRPRRTRAINLQIRPRPIALLIKRWSAGKSSRKNRHRRKRMQLVIRFERPTSVHLSVGGALGKERISVSTPKVSSDAWRGLQVGRTRPLWRFAFPIANALNGVRSISKRNE